MGSSLPAALLPITLLLLIALTTEPLYFFLNVPCLFPPQAFWLLHGFLHCIIWFLLKEAWLSWLPYLKQQSHPSHSFILFIEVVTAQSNLFEDYHVFLSLAHKLWRSGIFFFFNCSSSVFQKKCWVPQIIFWMNK